MKKFASVSLICLIISLSFLFCGFSFFKKTCNNKTVTNSEVITSAEVNNDIWCITLQLVWNDFMDKITNSQPVKLLGGNPLIVDELNKRLYSEDDISDDSYYKVYGEVSKKLKREIEQNIYKKFKEKSDILDNINWNAANSYLFYVMLKKNFTFIKEFTNLPDMPFNLSKEYVKYFGISKSNYEDLKGNVKVLFYNNNNDYAIKLLTKEKEEVILFRTDKTDSFENLYKYIADNTRFDTFNEEDKLRVPYINVDKVLSYDEICSKKVEGTNYVITQVLQTIKFKMDNKGGSLKSEAAIAVMRASLPLHNVSRHFYFDRPFVLFLKEASKNKPYYAMKIEDTKYLVKE